MRGYTISRISISNSNSVTQGNQKRYSTNEIAKKGVEYQKIDLGTKKDMYSKQTKIIKQYEKESGKLMETIVIQLTDQNLRLIKKPIGKIV